MTKWLAAIAPQLRRLHQATRDAVAHNIYFVSGQRHRFDDIAGDAIRVPAFGEMRLHAFRTAQLSRRR